MTQQFMRVQAGWYCNADGTLAVVVDGLEQTGAGRQDGDGVAAGVAGREWMLVRDPRGRLRADAQAGETCRFFDTKREAVAFAANLPVDSPVSGGA